VGIIYKDAIQRKVNKENTSFFKSFKFFLDPFEVAVDIGSHGGEGGKDVA
jgi:hypothetical protein